MNETYTQKRNTGFTPTPMKGRKHHETIAGNFICNVNDYVECDRKQGVLSLRNPSLVSGFTLVEVLVSMAIFIGIVFIIGTFMKTIFDYQLLFTQQLSAQQEVENTFAAIIPEVRSMTPSALGSYAIGQAATSSITFYTDVDFDGVADQVRYFLSGTTLKKGVIKPSGNPATYVSGNEVVTDVIHSVVPGAPIFTYYDANYTGGESAMPLPIVISNVRLMRLTVTVKDPNKNAPLSASIEIVPRNLRTNL